MTTYTPDQLAKALREATKANDAGLNGVNVLAGQLGLTVEDPKPEPGVYVLDGKPVILYAESFSDGREWFVASSTSQWAERNRDKLIPTRVIPEAEHQRLVMEADTATAEPVNLTEEQVGELWDDMQDAIGHGGLEWDGGTTMLMSTMDRREVTRLVREFLAKYGHGIQKGDVIGRMAPLVTREQVRTAVDESVNNAAGIDERNRIIDAVMALLKS